MLSGLLAVALVLGGCASRVPALSGHLPAGDPAPRFVELIEVPFHPQDAYQCGPAALATVLGWSGLELTAEALVPLVYLPARQGSLQPDIRATARAFDRLAYELEPRLAALLAELAAGHPVLVLQKLGFGPWPGWHYAVVVGYDAKAERFILRSGTERRQVLSSRRFLTTWVRAGAWALVTLPAGVLPASADPGRYQRAAADLEATGSAAAARAAWQAGAAAWPDNAAMWFGLGNAEYRLGNLPAAVAAFLGAVHVAPTHTAAHFNLARLYLDHDCLAAARGHLEAAQAGLTVLPGLAPAVAALRQELAARADFAAERCALK